MLRSVACLACVCLSFAWTAAASAEAADFRPIFDGQTLTGWRGDTNFWKVVDGAIVGESTDANPCNDNTFLVWDHGEVDDFELRLQFRISGERSGQQRDSVPRCPARRTGMWSGIRPTSTAPATGSGACMTRPMPRTTGRRAGRR